MLFPLLLVAERGAAQNLPVLNYEGYLTDENGQPKYNVGTTSYLANVVIYANNYSDTECIVYAVSRISLTPQMLDGFFTISLINDASNKLKSAFETEASESSGVSCWTSPTNDTTNGYHSKVRPTYMKISITEQSGGASTTSEWSAPIYFARVPYAQQASNSDLFASKSFEDLFGSAGGVLSCGSNYASYWDSEDKKFKCTTITQLTQGSAGTIGGSTIIDTSGSISTASNLTATGNITVGANLIVGGKLTATQGTLSVDADISSTKNVSVSGYVAAGTMVSYIDYTKTLALTSGTLGQSVQLRAPEPLVGTYVLTLPTTSGSISTVLTRGTGDSLEWRLPTAYVSSVVAGAGLTGGTINGSSGSGTIALATLLPTAATYGGSDKGVTISVDTYGRVASISTGTLNDATKLPLSGGSLTGMLNLMAGTATAAPLRIPAGTTTSTAVSGNIESNGTNLFWTNASSNRQTLVSYPTNVTAGSYQVLAGNGAGMIGLSTLVAGTNVSILSSGTTITISASGGGGGSGSLNSIVAGTGLTGGTITTAGTLAVNVGTSANQIVQLDGSGGLPAVSGANLTGLNASNLTTGTISYLRLPVGTGTNTVAAGSDGRITGALQTSGGTMAGALITNGTLLANGPVTLTNASSLLLQGAALVTGTFQMSGTVLKSSPVPLPSPTPNSVDWSKGHYQYTTESCKSFSFTNVDEGVSYSFVVKGGTSGTCTFTMSGVGGDPASLTLHFTTPNVPTNSNTHTIYNFFRVERDVYISWVTGL